MSEQYTVNTPGRVCLLGDNTDLIEKPTLAAAISAYLTLTIRKNPGSLVSIVASDIGVMENFPLHSEVRFDTPLRYLKAVYRRLERYVDVGLDVGIRSQIPIAAGLSSSTALCIAFIQALNAAFRIGLSTPEVAELAFGVESVDLGVECGRLDQYSIAYGGVTYIETGSQPRVQKLATRALPIVVADTQEKHNTQELQIWLRNRIRSRERLLLDSLGRVVGLVEAGKRAIVSGDLSALGRLMNDQQGEELLMGTSTERLELFCRAAREAGALGAKQMGAGGGGCVIALCPPGREPQVKAAFDGLGAPAWAFQIVGA